MMAEASTKKKSLPGKLASILAAVEKLQKDGHNDHFNYDYVTESAAVEHIRKLLAENGVAVIPSVKFAWQAEKEVTTREGPRKNWHSFVIMDYTLLDTESDASIISEGWPGEGMDSGDKGFYKAMTGAQKYFLLKTFMIPTGDDPEKDNGSKPRGRQTAESTITKAQAGLMHFWFDIAQVPEEWPDTVKASFGIEHWDQATKAQMDAVKAKLMERGVLAVEKDDKGKDVFYNPKDRESGPGDLDPESQEYLEGGGEIPDYS
jgi:hypothetical protein